MYFLDELDNFKLYRRTVLLPINEKDKKHTSLAFLLSPNMNGTKSILYSALLVPKYYNSFYIERAVLYYVNQEGSIDINTDDYIIEADLYDKNDCQIFYRGYENKISYVKSILNRDWFEKQFTLYKVNKNKISDISITVLEKNINSDISNIYIASKDKYPSDFKSYDIYCKYCAYMWLFYNINPNINDWLCMALALKESGVISFYNRSNWPFNYNLGIICRALTKYEEDYGRTALIHDIIKGDNGLSKLEITVRDILSLLSREIQKELKGSIYEDTLVISENSGILLEDKKYNSAFKNALMKDRIKTTKELKSIYSSIKDEYEFIRYTYNDIGMYNKLNLFVDLSSYNKSFLRNTSFSKTREAKAYCELLKRLINDNRFIDNGYNNQTVIIPMNAWRNYFNDVSNIHLINKTVNPLSIIFWLLNNSSDITLTDIFGDREVLFLGDNSFMKINFSTIKDNQKGMFLRNIRTILNKGLVFDSEAKNGINATSSARAIKMNIVDNIEKSRKIKIDDISTDEDIDKKELSEEDKQKKELVRVIDKNAKNNDDELKTLDTIDDDKEDSERIKKILSDLSTNSDNRGNNISAARASRMLKLQNDFIDSKFEGKKISDIIEPDNAVETELTPVSIDIDSINPEWKDLSFQATMDKYNLEDDIVRIFSSFYNKSNPLVVRSLDKEDTSTSEDLVETYTCKYEDSRGKRYTVKLDIPKFIDNKYLMLRGNRKNIPIQLFLMPILKTEENAVQIVSCYNKIFVRRFGTNSGKSNPVTDKLMKALNKEEYKHIKITLGDNIRVCSKYELPIDYIDMAANYSKIETPQYIIFFNQDELRNKYDVDDKNGLPIAIDKKNNKSVIYYNQPENHHMFVSTYIYYLIDTSLNNVKEDKEKFNNNFNSATTSVRYCYSRASILSSNIPLIVICGLANGLEEVMRKAHIKYSLSEKRPNYDKTLQDIIKFNDGYILYDLDYNSCLLMNGLKQCNTEDYSLTEINSRTMYLDFLDMFGGRIKADGLDNFQDCMIDPITYDTLKHYGLPTDYVEVLLHANLLLSDNKYTKHGDIRKTRRLRRQEQIASYLYEVLSSTYGQYSTGLKHGREIGFSCKQSAVIDRLLVGNTTDDQSILNALGEYENYAAVTPKGPSGMNTDRAYSLDKRAYDPSMFNVLSASTGFSGNVGITRQATIDANIEGSRGYIYNDPDKDDKINSVKSLCMTESLSPFIQTSKHNMRTVHGDPLLITTGADEALPYLISNTFAYKSKAKGKVLELVPDKYMIIEYDKELPGGITREFINLEESVQKNSSSGFYVTLKLDTDLKEGSRFKANQILAYDKSSFTDEVGDDDNIAYKIGTLSKFAILNTDEGFEDSAIVSSSLSEAMASDIVIEKEITIPKDASVYNLVKKGQDIKEGDTLMILQNAYDEDDVNILLRNLAGSEDEITNLGRVPITSKVTGKVQDIIIERTVEIDELSPILKKIVKEYENNIKSKKSILDKYGIEDINKDIQDTKALPATGKLKNASDCIVIRLYLSYHDKFKPGDKLIYGNAVKGVDKEIFPEGQEPYSEYRKNEKIHSLLSIGSINARMVTSVLITAAINKGLIELSRKVKDMADIKWDDNLI